MTQDDKPIPENAAKDIQVKTLYYFPYVPPVNVTEYRNDPIETAQNLTLDADGTKKITVTTLANATTMRFEVSCVDKCLLFVDFLTEQVYYRLVTELPSS